MKWNIVIIALEATELIFYQKLSLINKKLTAN